MEFTRENPTLVLSMGNDILSDDAVAFVAARRLQKEYSGPVDFEETGEAGLALLEFMEGYERVLLLDSLTTGTYVPGTVVRFSAEDFRKVVAPSPHYAGLPEVFELAERLGVDFPKDVVVLAMEVIDPFTVNYGLTPEVEAAVPEYVRRAREVLEFWRTSESEVGAKVHASREVTCALESTNISPALESLG